MSDYLCPRSRWADSLQEVRRLVDEEGVNPWKCFCTFATPLHHYCAHGNLGVVKYLIEEKGCDPDSWDGKLRTPLHYACEYGHTEVVKYLIETGHCDPNCVDESGRTPLHYATNNKNVETIKYLIENGNCDPDCVDQNGSTPLHYAIKNENMEIIKCLIETGLCRVDNNYALHYACDYGHIDVVKYLIETGHCDPNCVDPNGSTPLHCAARNRHMDVVKCLIETGRCDPNCVDKNGNTPLHYACDHGHVDVVKYLIETVRCNSNCVNENWRTPLHYACYHRHMEVVKYLIENGHCDPNCVDKYGRTLLHYACDHGHMDLVETGRCDPNLVHKYGSTPLHYACDHRHMEMFKYLIETGHCNPNCVDQNESTPLHYAAKYRHMDVVKGLIETGRCDPNRVDKYGNTPLHYACDRGHMDVVKCLIETGRCDPNRVDKYGNTPLHYACDHGHMDVVKCLIETGRCDPNLKNHNGDTPLYCAIKIEYMEMIKYLIETGHCDPNCVDKYGNTPLHYAFDCGQMDVVTCLIETGRCDPNCVDKYGNSALHYACDHRHMDTVKCLIETGHCDPNRVDRYGNTPLHYACDRGHMDTVKCLIETGRCDPNLKNHNGDTPLYCAIKMKYMEMIKYLIETGHCDPNCVDQNESTPLHYAAKYRHMDMVKCLIETGRCDPNRVDKYGNTPLHYVCGLRNMDTVKCLIETGRCDPNCKNQNGDTPLQYAMKTEHKEMVKYLLDNSHGVARNGSAPLHLFFRLDRLNCSLRLFKFLVESCNCDPECVDNNGWTPLHHASRCGYVDIVNYLLVECHCKPNCKTKDGHTPLDLAVNLPKVARELIKAGAKANTKLPQPPVKVFIVGNPSTGKTTLTKALQTETSALGAAMASIFGPQLVPAVEPQTAGIIPCHFASKKYGHVIFYDCAGQQEYYTSHAALIKNSISTSAPLFIIVVNLCDSEEDIKKKLAYWISLLENQCTVKPHVIIVGSHKDVVRSKGEDPVAKVNMEFLQRVCVSSGFVLSMFISIDCRQSNSYDMIRLAEGMKNSCDALREELVVTHRLHNLFMYLLEEFKDTPAVTFNEVLQSASSSTFKKFRLSAHNPDYLHTSCVSLNDSGQIIYLRHDDISKRWIILDQSTILKEVNGVLFAPAGFKQHCDLATGTTGMMLLSRLVAHFPHHNPDMLVELLSYLEFCREILDHKVLQLVNQEVSSQSEIEDPSSERYLFFPGLISTDTPSRVWEAKSHFSRFSGWMLQCCEADRLLTSQFLQVLLLHLAFSCALAPDDPGREDHPVLKRKCSIWKSGIYWGTHDGVEALVEIRDLPQHKQVVVMLRCVSDHEADCALLRSTIIKTVLEVKKKLCCKVPTEEFFLQPSQVRDYPLMIPDRQDLLSIREVSRAVLKGGSCVVDSTGRSVVLNDVLLVEPYAHLREDILQKLFSGETETIPDRFIYSIAECILHKKDLFTDILKPSLAHLDEKTRQAPPGRCEEFVCVLQCWRGDIGTYQSLRETLDQFSVFAGRNPLVSDRDVRIKLAALLTKALTAGLFRPQELCKQDSSADTQN